MLFAQIEEPGRNFMRNSIYQSGEYLMNNPDWHAADAPFKADWIAEILARNQISPGSIVEVGCGSGEVLVSLRKFLPDAIMRGFEISPDAHAIARQKEARGLSFHHRDFLAEPESQVDLLMAIDVFEHVDDYMGFLRGLRPRAKWKLFHIPLDLSVQALLRGRPILHSREVVGHLHYFFKDTALAVLKDCGFEIVDWNYTHGAEALPGRALRTRLFNLPRRLMRALHEDFAVRVMGGASLMVLAR